MSDNAQPDVYAQIDSWANELAASHPDLAQHTGELVDHVTSMVESAIAAGVDEHEALTNALLSLGEADLLAKQFRSADRSAATITLFGRNVPRLRILVSASVAYIVLSLAWAGFVIATGELNWMLFGWTVTALAPATLFEGVVKRSCRTAGPAHDG